MESTNQRLADGFPGGLPHLGPFLNLSFENIEPVRVRTAKFAPPGFHQSGFPAGHKSIPEPTGFAVRSHFK
jgi:hypothetical protein